MGKAVGVTPLSARGYRLDWAFLYIIVGVPFACFGYDRVDMGAVSPGFDIRCLLCTSVSYPL